MEGLVVRSIEEAIDNKISASVKESEEINAVVTRVDKDGTIWFHIPGGEDETPAKSTTSNVNPGDVVSVTISGGKATVSGNLTNPSMTSSDVVKIVDDAIEAKSVKAEEGVFERLFAGSKTVQQIKAALSDARKVATDFLSFDSSNGLVVGNLEGSTLGGNVQITGAPAVNIRNGSKTLASFEGDGITLLGDTDKVTFKEVDEMARIESRWSRTTKYGSTTVTTEGSPYVGLKARHESYMYDDPPSVTLGVQAKLTSSNQSVMKNVSGGTSVTLTGYAVSDEDESGVWTDSGGSMDIKGVKGVRFGDLLSDGTYSDEVTVAAKGLEFVTKNTYAFYNSSHDTRVTLTRTMTQTNYGLGTSNPKASVYGGVISQNTNGKNFGWFQPYVNTSGQAITQLAASNAWAGGTEVKTSLHLLLTGTARELLR